MREVIVPTSVDAFKAHVEGRLNQCRQSLREINSRRGQRTVDNTLRPLNELSIVLGEVHHGVSLVRSAHPDTATREGAEECERAIARFATEVALDRGLYEAVKQTEVDGEDVLAVRLRKRLLRDFHRAGVDRDEATRKEVQSLRDSLVGLSQTFSRNILGDVRSIQLEDPAELEGLPEDYVRGHSPDSEGRITITTEYPDYNPFMAYARSTKRREELYRAFRSRAHPQNRPVLKAILERRHRLATLLGYTSWADYVTEDKMVRRASAVAQFIDRVSTAAEKRAKAEYREILRRKEQAESGAGEVYDWEKGYYEELLRQERFQVDLRALRPYFSYRVVKEGLLSLVTELFGIRFQPLPNAPRWHEDVEVLEVLEDGRVFGRIYLDMHPRDGKFKHAAMFPLVHGIRGRCLPEAALVCNFPNPRKTSGPALLEHDDVVTLFHEFGHLLHHLFSCDHEWVEFSGTGGTEWDFVEVPSQLMEEWAWTPEVLQRFARRFDTDELIPTDLVHRLRESRHFGIGMHVRQQMFYASLSLTYHEADLSEPDIERLLRDLHDRYSCFRFVEGTYFHESFGHLDTYSAVYYTYMWSLVIEKDLFARFKEQGLMNREVAARYRARILAPGGTRDAAELVRGFLGREYSFDAFEEWLRSEGCYTEPHK